MSGGDYRVLFAFVKIKVGLSGGDVEQLKIQPSLWPVGGKPGTGIQAVSSTAPDDQGAAFIHKIHKRMVQISGVDVHIVRGSFLIIVIVLYHFVHVLSNGVYGFLFAMQI